MQFLVEEIGDDGSWPPLDRYYDRLDRDRAFRASGLSVDRALSFPELLDSFLGQVRARQDRPQVGATVHRHFDRLLRVWPRARLIHMLRDGRDVARSCIAMGWAGNAWTGAGRWLDAEQLWERIVGTLEPGQFVDVRYEDLVERPRETLTRICRLLELSFHPAMLEYARDTTYDAPDPSLAQAWRSKAAPEEVRLAEARLGTLLSRRGYPPSGLPALEVDRAAERRLRRQDRRARLRFRLHRYGAGLVAAELLTRRLGLRRLHRAVERRWQVVDIAHLK